MTIENCLKMFSSYNSGEFIRSYLPAFNSIYNKRLSDARLEYDIEISKCIITNNHLLLIQVNENYRKKVDTINLEYQKYNQLVYTYAEEQEKVDFMEVGQKMSLLKNLNKNYYNYVVDRAFSYDSPLSLFKFKYA